MSKSTHGPWFKLRIQATRARERGAPYFTANAPQQMGAPAQDVAAYKRMCVKLNMPESATCRCVREYDSSEDGFTLLELIVATTILSILTLLAFPLARITIQRERERRLHHALWEMRDAIDRYKEAGDRAAFQIKVDSFGYPPDLDTLVKGVEGSAGKRTRFLRSIPTDPMTNSKEWGLRSMQDDPDSDSWGGQNVFDVYTKSEGTALDGTKYKDW